MRELACWVAFLLQLRYCRCAHSGFAPELVRSVLRAGVRPSLLRALQYVCSFRVEGATPSFVIENCYELIESRLARTARRLCAGFPLRHG